MLKTKASPKANRYVPNRFNNLKWIQNPVTNHKVEQLLRAVLYPRMMFNPMLESNGYPLNLISACKQQVLACYCTLHHRT